LKARWGQIEHYDDNGFEKLLTAALYRAAELDCKDMPSDEELEQTVRPSQSFQRRMKAMLRNPNKYLQNQRRPIYLRALRSVAAAVIALTVLIGAAVAVSPTVRAAVIGLVRIWLVDRVEYETPLNVKNPEWTIGYIPEGFEVIDEVVNELKSFYVYENSDGIPIMIIISSGKQIVDNEHSVYYQITVNGYSADVYESNDPQYPNMLVIYEDKTGMLITIISEISLSELTKIGENIN